VHEPVACLLIGSPKGEIKRKHNSVGWIFSFFAVPLHEQGLFLRSDDALRQPKPLAPSIRPDGRLQNDLTNILSLP